MIVFVFILNACSKTSIDGKWVFEKKKLEIDVSDDKILENIEIFLEKSISKYDVEIYEFRKDGFGSKSIRLGYYSPYFTKGFSYTIKNDTLTILFDNEVMSYTYLWSISYNKLILKTDYTEDTKSIYNEYHPDVEIRKTIVKDIYKQLDL